VGDGDFAKNDTNKAGDFFALGYDRFLGTTLANKDFIMNSLSYLLDEKGVILAKNQWILTNDSDCSVSNFQLINWIKKKYINNNNYIYFASRNLPDSLIKKKNLRKIIGKMFNFFIKILFKIYISDTQCGFKLYKATYAKKIFKKIITTGYMHDIEIFLIANKLNFKIIELPVKWTHISESKINFIVDFIKIFFNLLKIKKHNYV
jgi:dolichyl-phosphate beta-glucosyltransferase